MKTRIYGAPVVEGLTDGSILKTKAEDDDVIPTTWNGLANFWSSYT